MIEMFYRGMVSVPCPAESRGAPGPSPDPSRDPSRREACAGSTSPLGVDGPARAVDPSLPRPGRVLRVVAVHAAAAPSPPPTTTSTASARDGRRVVPPIAPARTRLFGDRFGDRRAQSSARSARYCASSRGRRPRGCEEGGARRDGRGRAPTRNAGEILRRPPAPMSSVIMRPASSAASSTLSWSTSRGRPRREAPRRPPETIPRTAHVPLRADIPRGSTPPRPRRCTAT